MESNTYQETYSEYEEIDLRELILDIWNNKWLIIIMTFVFILIAGVYSFLIVDPVYQASTTIRLSNIEGTYSNTDTVIRLLKSNNLVMPVMNELEQDYSEAELQRYLENSMNIISDNNTGIIDISLKNKDFLMAEEILNSILGEYKNNADSEYNMILNNINENLENIELRIEDLQNQIKAVKQDINNISNSNLKAAEKSILKSGLTNELSVYIDQENIYLAEKRSIKEKLLSYHGFRFLTEPYVSENPVSPRKMMNLAIAAVLGVFFSIFIVFLKKFFAEDFSS